MQSVKTERSKYFQNIFKDIILRYGPQDNGGLKAGNGFYGQSANNHSFLYSKQFLTKDRVMASKEKVAELKHKHKLLVEAIRKIPIPSLDLFKGDGIVLAASPQHFTGALNIVVQVREMGSKLPVEIIMDSKMDYNKQLCEDTLPRLNGRCLIIEEVIGLEAFYKRKLDGFQYKALAILVSSFDNTIFLDSDSFPIKNVDTLLESNSFQKTKFLLWRDFWHKSTSPLFYEIAGIKTGEIAHRHGLLNEKPFSLYMAKNVDTEVLFHDLDGLPSMYTVESGQMVFSKREHFRSLVLASYYNYYGAMYYYELIYQGNFGAGDKDTFVPALHIMKEPYTITEYPALSGGNKIPADNDDGFEIDETTIVQVDPDEAASHQEKWREWLRKQGMDKRLNLCQQGMFTRKLRTQFYLTVEGSDGKMPTAFFLHVHNPKINSFANENPKLRQYDFKHRFIRAIGDFQDLMGPVDWELKFHSINAWITCVGLNDKYFWAQHDLKLDEICKKTKDYVEVLKESSNDESAAHLKSIQNWDE
ncbi:nucleotide-diphospho-sugar transferase [Metschnikowia bicuspidata]|uniref:Nucleotide-diphospho-sugar transferase n=1 Tax=Metschnikowia bicuspidata TaxID=27322 RepID=A0A4P9ZFQ4_9ASCO|nr:nucleotide-diphospho-sugar transferase [Metschnikowia bicuspidata]